MSDAVTYAYSRSRWLVGVAAQDALLAAALALVVLLRPSGPLTTALAIAIPFVLSWGVVTLHFPNRVAIDERGITFFAYGRAHAFAWSDVEHVRVRRFLIGDRVLVRIEPAPALRGRYWFTRGIEGYDALVADLERRASASLAPKER